MAIRSRAGQRAQSGTLAPAQPPHARGRSQKPEGCFSTDTRVVQIDRSDALMVSERAATEAFVFGWEAATELVWELGGRGGDGRTTEEGANW